MARPKTLFAVRFFRTVARVIAGKIIRANRGKWPANLEQWQIVAGRFGYVVLIVRDEPRVRTCCLFEQRVILVGFTRDERRLLKRIAHELAHGLLNDGEADGKRLLDWPRDEHDCHLTARIVEEWVDIALRQAGQMTLPLEE